MRWFWRGMLLVYTALIGSACSVTDTDEPTPVDAVEVIPTSLQVATGAIGALGAQVKDAAGNVLRNRRVVWASADPAIATVSDNGVVSGVAPGRVDIAATAEGKSAIANVTVVALPARVTTVRITPDKVNLFVAASTDLVATPYDAHGNSISGRSVVWTTNNAGIAAISQSGRVTGLLPGSAVITAVIEGVAANATVTVSLVPIAKVTVTPADVTVSAGKSTQLTARATDAAGNVISGRSVVWSSADTRVATVDQTGLVRGVRRGTITVAATAEGKVGTASVHVQ
jgi:uncharacterized protein YjdB